MLPPSASSLLLFETVRDPARLVAFAWLGHIRDCFIRLAGRGRGIDGLDTTTVHLTVKVSPGEFLDKLTILEIKAERIQDSAKRKNVCRELESLRADWAAAPRASVDVGDLMQELRAVNEALWEIEDRIRLKESRQSFDDEFIRLARSVYETNDRRAAIKRALNIALESDLIEEKSYTGHVDRGAS